MTTNAQPTVWKKDVIFTLVADRFYINQNYKFQGSIIASVDSLSTLK